MLQGLRRMASRLSATLQGFQQPPEDEKEDVPPIVHRMIRFRDMDTRLRAITGLVFAEMIAAVVAIVTSKMDLPMIDVVRPRFELGTGSGGAALALATRVGSEMAMGIAAFASLVVALAALALALTRRIPARRIATETDRSPNRNA